jgi:hypothetical protein
MPKPPRPRMKVNATPNDGVGSARRPGQVAPTRAVSTPRTAPTRVSAARSPKSRSGNTSWLPIVAAVLAVIALAVGGYFLFGSRGEAPRTEGVLQPSEGQTHVPEGSAIQYVSNPPSSGSHYPSPKPWGVYEETIPPGYWVHNLEHGGVVVLYDCPQACPEVTAMVRDALKNFPKDSFGEVKLVSTPYQGLPNGAKTAAVAWQWVETYPTSITYEQLLAFFNAHVNHSPENVP